MRLVLSQGSRPELTKRVQTPKDAAKPKKKTHKMLGNKGKVKGQAELDLRLRQQRELPCASLVLQLTLLR